MKFGRRRTEEQKKNNPHPEIDQIDQERAHYFRGFKLTDEQYQRLLDKFNKGYNVDVMPNRDIFGEDFTSNLDEAAHQWSNDLKFAADALNFSAWPGSTLDDQPSGTVMSEDTKRRILQESSGLRASGQIFTPTTYVPSGTHGIVPSYGGTNYALDVDGSLHLQNPRAHNLEIDVDALWEKMYKRFLKVIVVCTHCNVPQAINDGTCMHCGAPLPKPEYMEAR